MDKARIIEILQMLKHEIEINHHSGICLALECLYNKREIWLLSDTHEIKKIIYANKPKEIYDNAYWWPPGYKQPRIEFLNELIKQYSEGI
jgi:hypothetical protein